MSVATYFLSWLMLSVTLNNPILFESRHFPFPLHSKNVILDFSINNQGNTIDIIKYQYEFNSKMILTRSVTEKKEYIRYVFNKNKQIKTMIKLDSQTSNTNTITHFFYNIKRLINIYEIDISELFHSS